MLGMVWNADFVLSRALHPDNDRGVPAELFAKCRGIVLLTVVKAGLLVTGHAGTGVMMAKNGEGKWSPPVAVYAGGYAFGALLGKKDDDVFIFIMDDESMKDFATRPQTRLGATAAFSLGRRGGEVSKGTDLPNKGTVTVSMSSGVYTGVGLEMGTLETSRDRQNEAFYGKKAKPSQILFSKDAVALPKDSLIPDIHEKLEMLARGETWLPGEEEKSRSEHFLAEADKAEEEAKVEQK
jgi:lipid-binding SYLF domain-containing protein